MKKYILSLACLALAASCQHEKYNVPVDFTVTIDPSTTFVAGEPVKFNFIGNAENIIFYSGETGHNYEFRDRSEVPVEDVEGANLAFEFQARYGDAGAMKVYVSKTFDGLSGTDGLADRAKVAAMVAAGMPGWTEVPYEEGASTKWTSQDLDVTDYLDNFAIAFHWCPATHERTQRTYWINGNLSIALKGAEPTSMKLKDMSLVSVMMNEEIADPYQHDKGNGSIAFNNSAAQLVFQGVGANALTYALDGWVISQPRKLNKVAHDEAVVVKNIENYLPSYEYTYTKGGTYEAVFVGSNATSTASSRQVQRVTVTVLDKI